MRTLNVQTFVKAPPEVCFNFVRDPRVHGGMTIVGEAGSAAEEVHFGQRLTFERTYFGARQRFTVEVVELDRPRRFVDEMRGGAFKDFHHVHEFLPHQGGTFIKDTLRWRTKLGLLGRIADKVLIERYMRRLVTRRNANLKMIAELEEWKRTAKGASM